MITKLELIEYLKHTPENTNYNILYSSLYNGSNKEAVDEFIEVLSRGNLSLAALQPYLAKLYEDDKTISPDPLPPFSFGGGGVQPDWNQNDETAADHVKNRPFYTGDRVQTVLVEESTISFSKLSEGFYAAEFPSTFTATVGETYTVYWDGTAYECICANFESASYLGNPSIIDAGADTGEPFAIALYSASMKEIYTTDSSAAHTISISGFAEEVVKIDAKYLPFPFKPDEKSYLTFSSPNSFTLETATHTNTWNGTLEYFASDETWTIWDGASALPAAANGGEYVLYLRGTGNTVISGGSEWSLSGSNIACIGNIENLLDYATVESGEHPTMAEGCYNSMFGFCTSLTQAPELPATTLVDGCYANMFDYCAGLTQAPALPATTLARSCYNSMFYHCTSLTQAPVLPATTLADSCYAHMFAGCTSLTHLPALPATTLTEYCYQSMFVDCSSLKLSENKTGEYIQEYRIPSSGDGVTSANALTGMFGSTGGAFTGDPQINTTYYLSSDNMIVRGTKLATLNGYVKTMIDNAGGGSEYDFIIKTTDGTTFTLETGSYNAINAKVGTQPVRGKIIMDNSTHNQRKDMDCILVVHNGEQLLACAYMGEAYIMVAIGTDNSVALA